MGDNFDCSCGAAFSSSESFLSHMARFPSGTHIRITSTSCAFLASGAGTPTSVSFWGSPLPVRPQHHGRTSCDGGSCLAAPQDAIPRSNMTCSLQYARQSPPELPPTVPILPSSAPAELSAGRVASSLSPPPSRSPRYLRRGLRNRLCGGIEVPKEGVGQLSGVSVAIKGAFLEDDAWKRNAFVCTGNTHSKPSSVAALTRLTPSGVLVAGLEVRATSEGGSASGRVAEMRRRIEQQCSKGSRMVSVSGARSCSELQRCTPSVDTLSEKYVADSVTSRLSTVATPSRAGTARGILTRSLDIPSLPAQFPCRVATTGHATSSVIGVHSPCVDDAGLKPSAVVRTTLPQKLIAAQERSCAITIPTLSTGFAPTTPRRPPDIVRGPQLAAKTQPDDDKPPRACERLSPRPPYLKAGVSGRDDKRIEVNVSLVATSFSQSSPRRQENANPFLDANPRTSELILPIGTSNDLDTSGSSSCSSGAIAIVPSLRTPRTTVEAQLRFPQASPTRISPARMSPARMSPAGNRKCSIRASSGLVLNPGSATVDLFASSKRKERRFSFTSGRGGEQLLTPLSRQCSIDGGYRSNIATDGADVGFFALDVNDSQIFELPAQLPTLPGELFARFLSADSARIAALAFTRLIQACGGLQCGQRPFECMRRLPGLPWRAQPVWRLLEARLQHEEYRAAPLARARVIVCGAGPVGLRAALELSLLHAEVFVLEKRSLAEAFGRINRLHLWEWCKHDVVGWGAKLFDPPGGSFGGDNDFCHIGIGDLQLLLLKSALLLGVRVQFGSEADGVQDGKLYYNGGSKLPCDALILAGGANSALSHSLGYRSVVNGLRGKGSAIGVVANFVNTREPYEMTLRQFSWARQFNVPLFADLEAKTGVELENIVYYRGPAHHYMVMTPTKRSLLKGSVLLQEQPASGRLLGTSNVSILALSGMVEEIAGFFGLPTRLAESQGAMIFDFSGVRRLETASVEIGGLLTVAVGDALLEPFWPEGLGIVRGFLSAMDAAAAIATFHSGRRTQARARLAQTYNVLKSVAAQSASQCLQRDIRQYRLAPESRYIL